MDSKPKGVGSSKAWLDTVPMEQSSAQSAKRTKSRRSPSSRSRRRVSVWHRPLGEVVGEVAIQLAVKAASATLATLALGSMTKSRALMVIGRSDNNGRPSSALSLAFAGLGGVVRSAGTAWARFSVPTAKPAAPVAAPPAKPAAPRPVPRPAPFAAPSAASSVPLTKPSGEKVGAFNQQLYNDSAMALYYDPNGMGMLWVQAAGGPRHVAGPEAKWYFLAVLKRFEELGEAMTSFNPRYVAMTRSFAEALLEHPASDPIWKQMVADDPRHVARCFAGLDKPRNVVIDIEPSQIHRVASPSASTTMTL
jgi:hypothetical protein